MPGYKKTNFAPFEYQNQSLPKTFSGQFDEKGNVILHPLSQVLIISCHDPESYMCELIQIEVLAWKQMKKNGICLETGS